MGVNVVHKLVAKHLRICDVEPRPFGYDFCKITDDLYDYLFKITFDKLFGVLLVLVKLCYSVADEISYALALEYTTCGRVKPFGYNVKLLLLFLVGTGKSKEIVF